MVLGTATKEGYVPPLKREMAIFTNVRGLTPLLYLLFLKAVKMATLSFLARVARFGHLSSAVAGTEEDR
jgi:hypothetical protein